MDEYKKLKSEYEAGQESCQQYFNAMKAILIPAPSKSGPEKMVLTNDKVKVYEFLLNHQYPADVVQSGYDFNSYIFKPYVQQSDEFEEIYQDYTSKENLADGSTCEESQMILDYYSSLIPNLNEDFKRLTRREAFISSIRKYINSKKFMQNEPLNSVLVDLKVIQLLTENKFANIKQERLDKVVNYAEKQQESLQSEFNNNIGPQALDQLEKIVSEEEDDDNTDLKNLNKAHRKEIIVARKIRRKINQLMEDF